MPQFLINFEWHTDSKGYEIVAPAPRRRSKPIAHPIFGIPVEESLIESAPGLEERQRIVRCGGTLQPYRPLEISNLWARFADEATNAEGLLEFVKKYGPLTNLGYKPSGEPVDSLLEHANAMRQWQGYLAGDKSRLIERIGQEQSGISLRDVPARLTLDRATKKPRLEFTPRSLLDALWVQFGESASGNATFHQCHHCGKHFLAGTGTDRRADAKFCSPEHKRAFHSLNRSKKK